MQDSFYRGLTAEESERVHEYNFDHPGNLFYSNLFSCSCDKKVCISLGLVSLHFHWFLVSFSPCVFLDAFDTEQLLKCMGELKSAQSVNIPIYDFKNHRRCSESFRKVCLEANHQIAKMLFVHFSWGSS